MKRMIGMVAAVMVGAGCALAGTLTGVQAWAVRSGTNEVDRLLAGYGVTNAVDRAAVVAAWDEDVLVDTVLRTRAYGLMGFAMGRDKFATGNVARVKAAILAETAPVEAVLDVAGRLPVTDRAPFAGLLDAAAAVRYAQQPEYGRLHVKYVLLRGVSTFSPDVGEEDLVRYLVAPEGLTLGNAEKCKKAIKERAVALARVRLRASGKSFVVKDGVNPLVVMVQPVVAALNAPECAGVEGALRELGSTVADCDRAAMREAVAGWKPKVLSGEMGPTAVNAVLGKIAVELGPDAYNRFVEVYNNGSAGAK